MFPNEDKRPDYLTLYIDSQKCLITIIEMKKSNPDDAVDQILALYRKLKPEVERCFRFGTKVIYQGLILSKKLTDGADAKMKKTTELTIRPLRSERSHDIYPYISQELKGSNKVNSEKRNTLSEPQKESLEAIFQRSLHTRIEDTYWTANRPRKDKDGVYINFIISDEAYAILHSEGKNTSLLTSTSHCDTIQNQLSQLRPQSKISVETLTE